MTKVGWQYKVEKISLYNISQLDKDDISPKLNLLDDEGWEFLEILNDAPDNFSSMVVLFRRAISDE